MDNNSNMTAVEWIAKNLETTLTWEDIQRLLKKALEIEQDQLAVTEDTSDGYHTFKDLYEFRMLYNAALFNVWAKQGLFQVHKSWRHHDGELCFGGGWFIVVAMLPAGQITNHYKAEHWDLFDIPSRQKALFPFDGHNSADVRERLMKFLRKEP